MDSVLIGSCACDFGGLGPEFGERLTGSLLQLQIFYKYRNGKIWFIQLNQIHIIVQKSTDPASLTGKFGNFFSAYCENHKWKCADWWIASAIIPKIYCCFCRLIACHLGWLELVSRSFKNNIPLLLAQIITKYTIFSTFNCSAYFALAPNSIPILNTIDDVIIQFNPNQLKALNICLGFLLFGVALDIKLEDLGRSYYFRRQFSWALLRSCLCFPILTIAFIYLVHPPTSVALGMVLVAACPSGNISNFAVKIAKGNTAYRLRWLPHPILVGNPNDAFKFCLLCALGTCFGSLYESANLCRSSWYGWHDYSDHPDSFDFRVCSSITAFRQQQKGYSSPSKFCH